MSSKYGSDPVIWEKAKSEVRDALIGRAKEGRTICYSELAESIETIHLEADSYALAHLLGEISTEEDSAGRGMLSVIVVRKDSGMEPGPGFFKLARKLGRDTSDQIAFWVKEFERVQELWRAAP